jgi:hypothetical protein
MLLHRAILGQFLRLFLSAGIDGAIRAGIHGFYSFRMFSFIITQKQQIATAKGMLQSAAPPVIINGFWWFYNKCWGQAMSLTPLS